MLQKEAPRDFIISTGEAHSLEQFVAAVFAAVGLDWRDHVTTDPDLLRPTDISWSQGNPERAALELGWSARFRMRQVASAMVQAQLAGLPSARARD